MAVLEDVKGILADVLQLGSAAEGFSESTLLLGSLAELDSMTVVALMAALEEYYGFVIEDEEVSAEMFESVGTLVAFVEAKL